MGRTRVLTLLTCGALLIATAGLPAQSSDTLPAPQERRLELTFHGGTVTLIANNVTVREILAEWARRGGSRILNAERLQGAPVTLQFENQPEQMVMESLLRSAAGYVLGPRVAGFSGPSQLGVVSILPTTTSVAGPSYSPRPTYQAPVNTRPDDEIAPVTPQQNPAAPNAPGTQAPPAADRDPNQPATGATPPKPAAPLPASGVVPIVPITPVTTTPTTPTGGRGRGGGGGGVR